MSAVANFTKTQDITIHKEAEIYAQAVTSRAGKQLRLSIQTFRHRLELRPTTQNNNKTFSKHLFKQRATSRFDN